jgi:two-component system response regulator FixJ
MSGLELCAALAKRKVSWPVILMSGHSDMKSNAPALEQGILEIIEKPFKLDALLAVLDRAFAMLEGAGAVQPPMAPQD